MAKKYVLLVGVEFNNQGAYLMLLAAAEAIRKQFGLVPVVEFHNGTDLKKRIAGVYPMVPQRVFKPIALAERVKPLRKVWSRFPLVRPSEIAAVFDGSGFRYGDQWVHQNLDYTATKLADWAARGVPVYMLPQAFGPFAETAAPSRKAVRSARLVFARDPESEAYVQELLSSERTLRLAPDFTAALPGSFPAAYESLRGHVPIIPNINIYSRASGSQNDAYLQTLADTAKHLDDLGLHPYGLAHEGRRDIEVLEKVAALAKRQHGLTLTVVSGLGGVELKGLIGTAPLVVSGRYHAIVSALSQGVPTVIHGWSHKYQHVAEDFGAPELVCDSVDDPARSIELIDYIIATEGLSDRILAAAAVVKDKVQVMWSEIKKDLTP